MKTIFKIIPLIAVSVLFIPSDALAWGIGTHLYVSQKVADAIILNGPYHLSSLIARNCTAFVLGNIAPDIFAFRDWFLRTSSPVMHGWAMAHRLFRAAENDAEEAFSLGYISHLSSDVICHNFFIPRFIFMWEHRLKITHIIAEAQVDGYIGCPWPPDELSRLFGHSQSLNAFFINAAGIGKKEYSRNSALLQKAMALKRKGGIDGLAFKINSKAGSFAEKADYYIKLSANLSAAAVENPFTSSALGYCPEGEARIRLSRLRRRLSVRSKTIEKFRKEREEGKFEYIHRVPANLVTETI